LGKEVHVALLTTVMEIIGVLAALAMLLWVSTLIETRQLGPLEGVVTTPEEEVVPLPSDAVV
jgi:hypothetical protein